MIPGKAPSEAVQKDFIQQIEHYSQQKGTVLLFFDPCHLLHNVVNARMWQILDNARYNYAIATRDFAEENNIKLLFLPPYAPNINLIERL